MFAEDSLYQDFDLGTGALKARPLLRSRYGAESPVDGHALTHLCDEKMVSCSSFRKHDKNNRNKSLTAVAAFQ